MFSPPLCHPFSGFEESSTATYIPSLNKYPFLWLFKILKPIVFFVSEDVSGNSYCLSSSGSGGVFSGLSSWGSSC